MTQATVAAAPPFAHPLTWVENAHGVQSVAATLGLMIAAWWAWRGDWLNTRRERSQELELRKRENQQRDEKLRWDQARLAREINDEFLEDIDAREILDLVDCDAEIFETTDSSDEEATYEFDLNREEDVKAMRVPHRGSSEKEMRELENKLDLQPKEVHLRECFDAWSYWMALMEQHLKGNLIRAEDIDYPSSYYLRCLRERKPLYEACLNYVNYYQLSANIVAFLKRFEEPLCDG